jgi:hypothetical protein
MGEMTTIASLRDVRPGDLCFTKIGGFVPGVVPVAVGMLAIGERVRIGRLSFDHVLIATGEAEDGRPPLGVQAMPDGAEEIELTEAKHWNDHTVWCRLPEDWPGQARDAAEIARLMARLGVEYSFASYAMLAAWSRGWKTPRLEAHIDRRQAGRVELRHWSNGPEVGATRPDGTLIKRGGQLPAEAICSVLVDQAWTLAGARVMHGVPQQVVTPGALGMQLWRRQGVIWGGPTVLG